MRRLFILLSLLCFSVTAAAAEPILLTVPVIEDGGELYVNINQSHRSLEEIVEENPDAEVVETDEGYALVVGTAELSVNIDQNHMTADGELYVNIDQSH